MLQVTTRDSAKIFETLKKQIETLTVANAAAVRLQDEFSQVRAEKATIEARLAVELQTKDLMAAQFQAAEQGRLQAVESTTANVQRVQKMEQEITKLRKLLGEKQRGVGVSQPLAGTTDQQIDPKSADKASPSEIVIKYVSLNKENEA